MFKNEITVRFNECDSLGHVNNTNYFIYFEESRRDIFQIFNPNLSINDWNLIVASTQCDYIREVGYAQKIKVYSWISRMGTSSFTIEHAICDDANRWVARGKAVLASFDFETSKSVPLTEEIKERLLIHREGPTNAPILR
ncbi:thioesterase [Bacillus cereus]|nr:thioesterase [Bacillus cereus]